MCMFSGRAAVSETRIFARRDGPDRQIVVYAMSLEADADVAMVLPLPVRIGSAEDAVEFVDLAAYPTFFEDLELGFPLGDLPGTDLLDVPSFFLSMPSKLPVVKVGCLEASFVPTIRDFGRLDPRFRMPAGTWDRLPVYQDYGFAVFKLKAGASTRHPMAFSFPTRHAAGLFFPTVHVHDGEVHDTAWFDHTLYAQVPMDLAPDAGVWRRSIAPVTDVSVSDQPFSGGAMLRLEGDPAFPIDVRRARGVVLGGEHCHRHQLAGQHPNRDTWLEATAPGR